MNPHHNVVRQVGGAATAVVLATSVAIAAPTASAQSADETGSCPALHVILAPGTSETSAWSDPNQDNHGYLSKVIRPVMDQANDGLSVTDPGSGFSDVLQLVTDEDTAGAVSSAAEQFTDSDSGDDPRISRTTLTYPATAGGAWASMVVPGFPLPKNFGDLTSYEQSVESGVLQAEAVMEDIIDSCDDTDIALLGYSQGAEVVSSISRSIGSGESSIPDDRIAAVALFSDPTREGGTPALVNGEDTPLAPAPGELGAVEQTMTGLADINTPAASGLSPEKTGIGHFGTLSDRAVSWCLPGDYVCGLPAESKLATEIAGLLEKISLEDPVEALTLLAESMDSAVKISDFQQVADIDFGDDGFRAAGLTGDDDELSGVLAERAATAAEDAMGTDDAEQDATDLAPSQSAEDDFKSADDYAVTDTLPEVDEGDRADSELPGTLNDEDTATETTESSELPSETTLADESTEDTASSEPAAPTTQAPQADDSATSAAPEPEKADPFSSPQAFADAAIPAAARLGGMALGTAATVVKDTLTPQNVAQIGIAGVAGGPQAAATVATDKFIQSGMKLLEPGMASGKAREVLTIVEDSGFEVPEIMTIAVELSAWLSVNEHIQYGERALMPDGRSAEKATQDWLLAAAGDASGDTALTDDLLGDAVNFGTDFAREVAFDPEISEMATDALREAMN